MAKLVDRSALAAQPDSARPVVVAAPRADNSAPEPPRTDSGLSGARKLIRPRLPAFLGGRRRDPAPVEDPLTHALNGGAHAPESTHAEAFYFQKQIQQSTEMTFVLDDGEELQGMVEWYDRAAVKLRLRDRTRVLIYKSGIKYLFKTAEAHPAGMTMK